MRDERWGGSRDSQVSLPATRPAQAQACLPAPACPLWAVLPPPTCPLPQAGVGCLGGRVVFLVCFSLEGQWWWQRHACHAFCIKDDAEGVSRRDVWGGAVPTHPGHITHYHQNQHTYTHTSMTPPAWEEGWWGYIYGMLTILSSHQII